MKRPSLALAAGLAVMLSVGSHVAQAHGPDPMFSGNLWARDQVVGYTWRTGQVPPDWMATTIDGGAADANATRASRAATFSRVAGAASLIAYGEPTNCSSAGLACIDRSGAPTSFRMWFRATGYAFDWGTFRWCQAPSSLVDGCYDARTVTLDEFGHIEILAHHVNLADGSDFGDAVVQAESRPRPQAGWNAHAFGRCDVARLQLEYERRSTWDTVSTCLKLATAATLAPSSTAIVQGEQVRFTATLRITSDTANRALAGDALSGRVVILQRRAPGGTTWTTVSTMTPSTTVAGSYAANWPPSSTYDWRATFATPSAEGLVGSASATVRITVDACTTSICPNAVLSGGARQ